MLDQQKYDGQMADLADELAQLRRALGRKTTARENLFSMLEEPGFDRALFAKQMERIGNEVGTLEAQIGDVEERLAALERAKANHQDLIRFVRGNAEWLWDIVGRINNLEPQEKQKLVESLLDGKIVVEYAEETETWLMREPLFRFGPDALQALVDVGAFDKVYNHQSGARGRAQGWHRLRPAGGSGRPGGSGPAAPGASGKAFALRGVVSGRPFETHPGGAVHGPGHPGGGFGPDHLQGQRAGGRGGPGGRGLCRGEPGPGGGASGRPASPGPGGAGTAGPGR